MDKYQVMARKQLAETLVVLFSRTQLPALHLVAVQLLHKWSRLKIALFFELGGGRNQLGWDHVRRKGGMVMSTI